MPVAETFMFEDEEGLAVRELAMLDTTVRAIFSLPVSLTRAASVRRVCRGECVPPKAEPRVPVCLYCTRPVS
jgi:hypothetical protein